MSKGAVVTFQQQRQDRTPRSRCQTKKGKRTRDEHTFTHWNDAVLTEHHTIPRSRGGTNADIIVKPWGLHRRWHEIFDLATPEEAIERLEAYAAKCRLIPNKAGVIVDFQKAKKRKKARLKLLRLREAWETLFGTLPLHTIRAKIRAEWTVEGLSNARHPAIA